MFSFVLILNANIDIFQIQIFFYVHIQISIIINIELSILIKNSIRKLDSLSRWGGEEFIVLCPQTELDEASKLGEKLRLLIEEYQFTTAKSVTSSFGVTNFMEDDNTETVLKRLDNALYKAKDQGRNCVVVL